MDELLVRLFHAPRILVVEDAQASLKGLLHARWDCVVDTAGESVHAIKLIASRKYDIIILDIGLLNGTSNAVMGAAKANCPDTPLIVTRVDRSKLNEMLTQHGPLFMLSHITIDALEHLFRIFKIRARTQAVAAYCDRVDDSTLVPAVG